MKTGTRSSRLALIQAESALALLQSKLPDLKWSLAPFSSPGDRDKQADLLTAPDNFFTSDLDEALLSGQIDCAVHSAKDMPDPLPAGMDYFWLPDAADPHDVWVGSLKPKIIGVSSGRRSEYAKKRFPNAEIKPLRGTIEERLEQLDTGKFDALIMAAAALQRLGLEQRLANWISPDDLPVPDGQGSLALTFRSNDERFLRLRTLFVKPVHFVSAGAGTGLCTQSGIEALRRAEICLYDALIDPALLNECSSQARKIYVGKQYGRHSHTQTEICELLIRFARQGKRVVRLKGGDAGLFGRLAEETATLDVLQLPYRVVPGVSSLLSATTATGLLLTRRGIADSVRIISGHSAEDGPVNAETEVIFMGTRTLTELARERIAGGANMATPAAVVFSAGRPDEKIVFGTLETIASQIAEETGPPGLILIGPAADEKFRTRSYGALRGKKIWLTCSNEVQTRAAQAVLDFGGVPVQQPLIKLIPTQFPDIGKYDWIVLTSPSTVRCLMPQIDDLRKLPKLLCCGQGTANSLKEFQLTSDAMPEGDFNTEGLLETARKIIPRDARILRLRSDLAGTVLAEKFRKEFQCVDDFVLCENQNVECDAPECDAVFFASVSAINSYVKQFGIPSLNGKIVVTIGPKDTEAILKAGWQGTPVAPARATVEDAVEALATYMIQEELAI
ncbi:MAG: uroporphyrinogen-III synthase [Verrucomicrobia bacterium]|nr:uroporphyrinogen-III synthase [Verrucomicrobiota bacterium]